jgi:hypothetical protein
MDSDSCYAWDSVCGDLGFTLSTGVDVQQYGTKKFTMKTFGNVSTTFTGKVIVEYVP